MLLVFKRVLNSEVLKKLIIILLAILIATITTSFTLRNAYGEEIEDLKQRITLNRNMDESLQKTFLDMIKQVENLRKEKSHEQCDASLKALEEKITNLKDKDIKEIKDALEKQDKEVKELKAKVEKFEEELSEVKEENKTLKKQVEGLISKIDFLTTQSTIRMQVMALDDNKLKAELETAQKIILEKRAPLTILLGQLNEEEQKIENLSKKEKKSKKDEKNLQEAKEKRDGLKLSLNKIEQELIRPMAIVNSILEELTLRQKDPSRAGRGERIPVPPTTVIADQQPGQPQQPAIPSIPQEQIFRDVIARGLGTGRNRLLDQTQPQFPGIITGGRGQR